jgi:hypothetical protein
VLKRIHQCPIAWLGLVVVHGYVTLSYIAGG